MYKFGTASLMILLAAARLVSLSGSQRQIVPRVRRAACACGGAARRQDGRGGFRYFLIPNLNFCLVLTPVRMNFRVSS